MRKMAKLLLVFVVVVTLVVTAACGAPTTNTPASEAPAPASDAAVAPASDAAPASEAPASDAAPAPADLANKTSILVGIPNPSTGAAASFGEGTPWTENYALEQINKDGGIFIKELNKKLPVELKFVDTESDQTKAGEVASKLILEDKVDILIVRHTPDNVNPVTALAERYEIPCISMECPVDAWLPGGPYNWSFHSFWRIESVYKTFTSMWKKVGLEKSTVGLLFPNDADGEAWTATFAKKLPEDGYTVVDPGRYPVMTSDFTSIINEFKEKKVDIITGCDIPPDFATFWKQAKQQGLQPKFVTMGKAYLFKSEAMNLGPDLANGLSSEVWWSPWHPFKSSLSGETAQQLCDAWTAETGREWTPPIGYKYAPMEVLADVLNRAQTLDKTAIRDAIAATDLDTIVGHIKFNDEHFAETPIIGGQWVKDGDGLKLNIISNEGFTDVATTADPLFPLPTK